MSNDKHQALRDAAAILDAPHYAGTVVGVDVTKLRALLADHDRMREALEGLLNALPSATTHPAIKAAREALKDDEQ